MSAIKIEQVIIWNLFKEKFLEKIDESDPFEVDLAFEYKDSTGTVISYTSGEQIFIIDVKVSPKGDIAFEVPHGPSSRHISIMFADSISNPLGTLEEVAFQCYLDALEELMQEEGGIYPESLIDYYKWVACQSNLKEVVSILNTSSEWIKKTRQLERDKKSFQKLDEFGMF